MLRRLIIEIILFAFPFIVYFGGRAVARALKPEIALPDYNRRMPYLIVIGAAFAVAGFVLVWALEPKHVNESYTPSHVENGEFKPGVVSRDAPPREAPALTPMQEAAKARGEGAVDDRPVTPSPAP